MNRSRKTAELLTKLNIQRDSYILDAGCGYGETIKYLQKIGYHNLRGIDINPQYTKIVSETCDIVVDCGTLLQTRYPSDTFDAILILDVLEHVDKGTESEVIRELIRVLKPGGAFILSVPYFGVTGIFDPANILKVFSFNRKKDWHRHYSLKRLRYYFNHQVIIQKVERRGIGLSQLLRMATLLFRKVRFLKRPIDLFLKNISEIDYSIQSGPFSYHIIIAGTKKIYGE